MLAGLSLTGIGRPAGAEPVDLDPERLTWRELTLVASKFGLTSRAVVRIDTVDPGDVATLLPPDAGGGALELPAELLRIDLETRFLRRRNLARVWFDPRRATAFESSGFDEGRKHYYKASRFSHEGVLSERRRPQRGQEKLDPSAWGPGELELDPFPDWLPPGEPVTSPGSLLYALSVLPLTESGPPPELATFVGRSVSLVSLVVEGRERTEVRYLERLPGGEERRIRRQVDALRVALRPFTPEDPEKGLRLLGLRGVVRVLVDPEARLPLEVRGRVPVAGMIRIRLEAVTRR